MKSCNHILETDIAGAMLHDQLRRSPVSSAIKAHLTSVHADEAQFDDNGVAIDPASAVQTFRDEIRQFRELCEIPCETAEDAQAKLRYILHGTTGERANLLECLMDAEYGFADAAEGLSLFLKSLLVPDFARALAHGRVAPGAHAREEQSNG